MSLIQIGAKKTGTEIVPLGPSKKDFLRNSKEALEIELGTRDDRVANDREVERRKEELNELLEETLREECLTIEDDSKKKILSNLVAIHETLTKIKWHYLDLGKSLLRIANENEKVYTAITRRGARILGFDGSYAVKYKRIAEVVEEGLINRLELPPHITVAYEVCSIDEKLIPEARKAGIIRPTVMRKDALEFKARIRKRQEAEVETPAILRTMIGRLEMRKDEIMDRAEAKIKEIDAEIAKLQAKIEEIGTERRRSATATDEKSAEAA